MALSERNPGGRIDLLDPSVMNDSQTKLYNEILKVTIPWARASGFIAALPDGKLVGPFNLALVSPEIGLAFANLQSVEESSTTLSQRVRQVVILTVGAIWNCAYERYAHRAVAHAEGLAQQAIDDLAEGREPTGLADDERLAWQVTKQIVVEHSLKADLFERAQFVFGNQGLVNLLFLAGCYVTICSLLNSFEIPIP